MASYCSCIHPRAASTGYLGNGARLQILPYAQKRGRCFDCLQWMQTSGAARWHVAVRVRVHLSRPPDAALPDMPPGAEGCPVLPVRDYHSVDLNEKGKDEQATHKARSGKNQRARS